MKATSGRSSGNPVIKPNGRNMFRYPLILAVLLVMSGSYLAVGQVRQDTKGECANAIAYVNGNVTIQCGLQKEALQPLVASLQDDLPGFFGPIIT